MNELTLADLDMGTCLPQVLSTSTPTLDNRGTFTLEMDACLVALTAFWIVSFSFFPSGINKIFLIVI